MQTEALVAQHALAAQSARRHPRGISAGRWAPPAALAVAIQRPAPPRTARRAHDGSVYRTDRPSARAVARAPRVILAAAKLESGPFSELLPPAAFPRGWAGGGRLRRASAALADGELRVALEVAAMPQALAMAPAGGFEPPRDSEPSDVLWVWHRGNVALLGQDYAELCLFGQRDLRFPGWIVRASRVEHARHVRRSDRQRAAGAPDIAVLDGKGGVNWFEVKRKNEKLRAEQKAFGDRSPAHVRLLIEGGATPADADGLTAQILAANAATARRLGAPAAYRGRSIDYLDLDVAHDMGVAIRQSEIHGLGLFAIRDCAAGAIRLPVRSRELIPHSRAAVRSEKHGSYLWSWGDGVIDETWQRSVASFANHSREANAVVLDDQRPVLVNVFPLKSGEEIVYSYGPDFRW